MSHEFKKEETNSEVTLRDTLENILQKVPIDELLGSLTTYPEGNDKNQSVRSSARVFKKIKLDANLNAGPSTSNSVDKIEKKDEHKPEHLPQNQQKRPKPSWSPEERLLFFEALNEHGKDFEGLHNYIIQKLKRKGVPDNLLMTKEHVRHLYYKTWHKISKYLKFSEGTKKAVQELYALINYGELRKKIGFFTQKINHKLNELIFHGCVTIRVKGKMVKVKTPMCPALRRLNKLNDKDEDLKLPQRVLIELRPRDMNTFLKVQNMALNPRIRTVLPLQKKLSTLITSISKKWKAAEYQYLKNNFPTKEIFNGETDEENLDLDAQLNRSYLKFVPPKDVKVNVPKTNINEYFTRESVCLKAFEEKMGIGRSQFALSLTDKKDIKKAAPKSRTDSVNEHISKSLVKSEIQDTEKIVCNTEIEPLANINVSDNIPNSIECPTIQPKSEDTEKIPVVKTEDDIVEEALNNFFSSIKNKTEVSDKMETNHDTPPTQVASKVPKLKKDSECLDSAQGSSKTEQLLDNNKNNRNISAEEQLSRLEKIRNGWTIENCDNLTIGELYLMFGSASKIVLEYHWTEKKAENAKQESDCTLSDETVPKTELPDNWNEHFGFSNALRKLVSIVKLQQTKPASKCPCGHVCSPKNAAPKKSHSKSTADNEEKVSTEESVTDANTPQVVVNTEENKPKSVPFDDFVRPQSKPPPVHLMAQLDSIQKLKPKYMVRKGRRMRTKQVVVERELPLTPKASSAHQIVCMNIISQSRSNDDCVSNMEDHCEVDTQTVEGEMDNFAEQVLYLPENGAGNSEVFGMKTSHPNIRVELSDAIPSGSGISDNLSVYLQDSLRSMSPSGLLKENANHWISSEVGDFSLSSFLGHLESPMKTQDYVSHDVDAQLRSLLTENSFDYTAKFADLANKVANDTAN